MAGAAATAHQYRRHVCCLLRMDTQASRHENAAPRHSSFPMDQGPEPRHGQPSQRAGMPAERRTQRTRTRNRVHTQGVTRRQRHGGSEGERARDPLRAAGGGGGGGCEGRGAPSAVAPRPSQPPPTSGAATALPPSRCLVPSPPPVLSPLRSSRPRAAPWPWRPSGRPAPSYWGTSAPSSGASRGDRKTQT